MHMRHLMALSYVRDHDGGPQQELAEALCMDANNVVLLLNELEQLGYVGRRRDPSDRRRHLVDLTSLGAKALEKAEHRQETIEDDVLQALDREERATLWRLLGRALRGAEPGLAESCEDAGKGRKPLTTAAAQRATTASISTSAPFGSSATPTAARAGGAPAKNDS